MAQARGDHPGDGLWALAGMSTDYGGGGSFNLNNLQIMLKIKEGNTD